MSDGADGGEHSFCRKLLYSNAEKGIVMDELIDKGEECPCKKVTGVSMD